MLTHKHFMLILLAVSEEHRRRGVSFHVWIACYYDFQTKQLSELLYPTGLSFSL